MKIRIEKPQFTLEVDTSGAIWNKTVLEFAIAMLQNELAAVVRFRVVLRDPGSNKIATIKEIRDSVRGLGVAEAKQLSENCPCVISGGLSEEEAKQIYDRMVAVGATVVLERDPQ